MSVVLQCKPNCVTVDYMSVVRRNRALLGASGACFPGIVAHSRSSEMTDVQ